jgi:phospholipase C
MQSRRDFIKKAAMLAGAAGFAGGLPDSISKAFAIAPDPGTTWADAEHVVILMQENRSFDHSFGTLQGVRGFNDPRATRQANGNSVFLQTNAFGDTYQPWRLDIRDTKITWMGSIPHSRHSQVDAWNHGHHNQWIDAKRSSNVDYKEVPITMGHYTREDIPFYFALADAFTVCDQNYCGVMSSTTPNRSIFWTGTVRDEQKADSMVFMRNPEYHGRLKWKTYPERLTDAGINWKIYQNEVNARALEPEAQEWLGNVGNITEHFGAFNVHVSAASTQKIQADLETAKAELAELQTGTVDATMKDDHTADIQQKQEAVNALQAQIEKARTLSSLTPRQQELHTRAFVTNVGDPNYHSLETISFDESGHKINMNVPKGDVLHQFRKDVAEGTLPTISWLVPPGKFSDHPTHPWYGAWFVSEAVDILTKNPEVWKKTIFILTYDENDGYFDHAPSFVAADPQNKTTGRASTGIDTALEYSYSPDELAQGVAKADARSGPIGLGFRVPMIVASPWSRGGYVNSQLFDHSSSLQFLETFIQKKYGKTVKETNISEFRRAICGDLTSCFRMANNSTYTLPFLDRDKFVVGIERAKFREVPSNYKKLSAAQIIEYNKSAHTQNTSQQEPGIRPANALPYEMYAEGSVSDDGKSFSLAMRAGNSVHSTRSSGAPFNVYLRNTAQASGAVALGHNNQNMFVATYALKAGDTMQELYPLSLFAGGKYEIDVHGPNGFYRSFRGDTKASPITAHCVYERSTYGLSGNVIAHIKNLSASTVMVIVTDNSYKTAVQTQEIATGQDASLVIGASKSHGWYDFTVRTKGSDATMHYAGRVETGYESFTDPLMGRAVA